MDWTRLSGPDLAQFGQFSSQSQLTRSHPHLTLPSETNPDPPFCSTADLTISSPKQKSKSRETEKQIQWISISSSTHSQCNNINTSCITIQTFSNFPKSKKMEEYLEELRTPPMTLISIVGCPELHTTISKHLHSEQPPINTLALPDFTKISLFSKSCKG